MIRNLQSGVMPLSQRHLQMNTLVVVIVLNVLMFIVELTVGLWSHSAALLGDSLDMLGDAVAYSSALLVVGKSNEWKYRSALFKSFLLFALSLFVLFETVSHFYSPQDVHVPSAMLATLLALLVNSICLVLLNRHRGDDINMRAAMVCSHTDVIANLSVFFALFIVWLTGYTWFDSLVGLVITVLFMRSAYKIFLECQQSSLK